jgi:hypothetical protein
LLEGESFEKTLKMYNNKSGIDMVAMITYPKNLWDRLFKKRWTKDMAFHSKIPVISITGNKPISNSGV